MTIGIADLAGVRAKITRAREHQSMLKTEFDDWAKRHAKICKYRIWRDGDWEVVSVDPIPKPDIRCSVIAGDIIHNLRSALDHLVWQLVIRDGYEPSFRNQFPIYTSKKEFIDRVKFRKNDPKQSELYGITVNSDAWKIIEQAQPYTKRYNFIGILGRLSIMDKHKTLYVQIGFVDNISKAIGWNNKAVLLEHRNGDLALSYRKPTEIIRYRFADYPDPDVQVKGKLTVNLTLGEGPMKGGRQLGVGTFILLINEVTAIVDKISGLPGVVNT
jgi:hypothetical protein